MGPMQVAQFIFNGSIKTTGNDNPIPADTVDEHGVPTTGETKGMVTLRLNFPLAPVHVQDPALSVADLQVNLAAQALALAEDKLFFSGEDARDLGRVEVSPADLRKLGKGLLGTAAHTVNVDLRKPHKPGEPKYGLHVQNAVVEGIARFSRDLQGSSFALILSPDAFADINIALNSTYFVTAATAIQSLLGGSLMRMSPGLPDRTGLLVALGGKATTLYVGTAPVVEFDLYNGSHYSFTARESIQFVNTDPRSLIRLEFEP
jgi:uncharacterized linocin/CFP29 family protein